MNKYKWNRIKFMLFLCLKNIWDWCLKEAIFYYLGKLLSKALINTNMRNLFVLPSETWTTSHYPLCNRNNFFLIIFLMKSARHDCFSHFHIYRIILIRKHLCITPITRSRSCHSYSDSMSLSQSAQCPLI